MELKLLKRRAEMLDAVSSGKATTEYAKTKGLLYVRKLLGHRSLKTTLRYTQLPVLPQNEEYICKAAKTVKDTKELIEARFQYVTDIDDTKLFRKIKTSYIWGSPSKRARSLVRIRTLVLGLSNFIVFVCSS